MSRVPSKSRKRPLRRLKLFRLVWVFLLLLYSGRLVQLTILRKDDVERWALNQHQRVVVLPPDRGSIFDRNGELLAISVDVDSVFASPPEIRDPLEAARRLAPVLGKPEADLHATLKNAKGFAWLARQVRPEVARQVFELGLEGVRFLKESKRYYPKKRLAGQLLGFLNTDSHGLEGIEQRFDDLLRGQPGRILTEVDARQRRLYSREQVLEERTSGQDLILTIDHRIQHVAERELEKAVVFQKATSGVVVVMDPVLGDVLALATVPTFDPNLFKQSSAEDWRNRGLSDVIEPGSTFKPFVIGACLEQGLCQPDEKLDCEMGFYRVGGHTFEDHDPYGMLTVAEILKHSSNIGSMKIGARLGKDRLFEMMRAFGFGRRLTDFPPEAPGRLPSQGSWSGTTIPALSMGYEILVTPLQLACAYSAIANDGLMVRPRFIRGPQDLQPPEALGRVLSPQTARALREMLRGVVDAGTATAGQLEGISAAGKTGTTKKIDPKTKRYSPTAVRATFVGMVPAEEPALVILVSLDDPKVNPWGGLAAAPVFKQIAQAAIAYRRDPEAGLAAPVQGMLRLPRPVGLLQDPQQLLGLTAREALREAKRAGWALRIEGRGYARRIEEIPTGSTEGSRVLSVQFEPELPTPTPAPTETETPTPEATASPSLRRDR